MTYHNGVILYLVELFIGQVQETHSVGYEFYPFILIFRRFTGETEKERRDR